MTGVIKWLEELNAKETRVRAILRRSLSFAPGTFPPAYPYIEPFLKGTESAWRREMYYLVAALWAAHWRDSKHGEGLSIGRACAIHQIASGSTSTERRFIALLDADRDQLPNRLRQMIALLTEQAIDFDALLSALLYWEDDGKRTQNAWARDFYRELHQGSETGLRSEKEAAQ